VSKQDHTKREQGDQFELPGAIEDLDPEAEDAEDVRGGIHFDKTASAASSHLKDPT
jgi:hypothetical protein